MTAEYFAQVNGKKIVAITAATPSHELKENQIALSKDEYDFLKLHSLEQAEIIVRNVNQKIQELHHD